MTWEPAPAASANGWPHNVARRLTTNNPSEDPEAFTLGRFLKNEPRAISRKPRQGRFEYDKHPELHFSPIVQKSGTDDTKPDNRPDGPIPTLAAEQVFALLVPSLLHNERLNPDLIARNCRWVDSIEHRTAQDHVNVSPCVKPTDPPRVLKNVTPWKTSQNISTKSHGPS